VASQIKVTDEKCFLGFDAYEKVIGAGVDYVLLCTPPVFRGEHFKAAVGAGKHVFVEKPIAVDPVGVRGFLETAAEAEKKKLGVMAGTVFRHQTTHREAIAQIHSGEFGEVRGGTSYYNVGYIRNYPRQAGWSDLEYQIRNWWYFTWLSGDLIVEQAMHRMDITNWIMKGPPVSAYGMGGRQVRVDPAFGNVYDHFAVEYEYAGGVKVANQCRQIDGCDPRVTEYYAMSGGVMLEPSKGARTGERKAGESLGLAYVREHRDLIESVRRGEPVNEGRQVAESTLTAMMGRMSAYTGRLVTWEEAMGSELDLRPKGELKFGAMSVRGVAMPGERG
jgi:predicted dehydrogenase